MRGRGLAAETGGAARGGVAPACPRPRHAPSSTSSGGAPPSYAGATLSTDVTRVTSFSWKVRSTCGGAVARGSDQGISGGAWAATGPGGIDRRRVGRHHPRSKPVARGPHRSLLGRNAWRAPRAPRSTPHRPRAHPQSPASSPSGWRTVGACSPVNCAGQHGRARCEVVHDSGTHRRPIARPQQYAPCAARGAGR